MAEILNRKEFVASLPETHHAARGGLFLASATRNIALARHAGIVRCRIGVEFYRATQNRGETMTWQELFDELSKTQADAFRARDVTKVRHTVAGIETFVRNYQDAGCPDHAATMPEAIVSHIRREMALRFPGGG